MSTEINNRRGGSSLKINPGSETVEYTTRFNHDRSTSHCAKKTCRGWNTMCCIWAKRYIYQILIYTRFKIQYMCILSAVQAFWWGPAAQGWQLAWMTQIWAHVYTVLGNCSKTTLPPLVLWSFSLIKNWSYQCCSSLLFDSMVFFPALGQVCQETGLHPRSCRLIFHCIKWLSNNEQVGIS